MNTWDSLNYENILRRRETKQKLRSRKSSQFNSRMSNIADSEQTEFATALHYSMSMTKKSLINENSSSIEGRNDLERQGIERKIEDYIER